MTVREETQTIERLTLSPYAALSEQSFGRRTPEPEDDLRTCYPVSYTHLTLPTILLV